MRKLRWFLSAWAALVLARPLLAAAPQTKSGFVSMSDGVRLHYLESGDGPAILFVPGWTMPAEIWEQQIAYFSRSNRVVALDPRSQGESDKPSEGHYPERRARDYKEVVDQLKLAPVVLVGWSLAVPELLTYVDQFGTGAVRTLVLVDGPVGSDPAPERIPGRWNFLKQLQLNRAEATEQFVRRMYKKPQPEPYLKKITAAALKTPTNTAVVLLGNLYVQGDWRPVLAKLDRPTLFVVQQSNKAQADMVQQKLPSARVEIFEDAGHALFVDDADRFNKLLDDFLKTSPQPK